MASDHRPILVELRTVEKADKIFRMKPYLQNPVGNGITVMWGNHRSCLLLGGIWNGHYPTETCTYDCRRTGGLQ